ncbi:SOS response-associated peptidase family protein [Colwelliaceae bacterium 6471]
MCGRLNVSDDIYVKALVQSLGINVAVTPIYPNRFVRAASSVQIIKEVSGQRILQDATWWLLLEQTEKGFKPSKYTSFNTRYDKLNVPRTAGFIPFRQSRCIIPAKGFGETEFIQQGNKKIPSHYHDLIAKEGAIAFGGLYKEYVNKSTGEFATGCSVITLPPHEKLKNIHTKASPLMLPQDSTMDDWLNPDLQDVEIFNELLTPAIRQTLEAVQIDKPSTHYAIAEPFVIEAD